MPKVKIDETFEMHYDLYDFMDPWRKDTECLLLVHGNTRNSKFWYWYVPRLAAHYRVATLDWRGHGQSAPPPDFRPTLPPLANDVRVLIDHLGWGKFHFVAEATGGPIGCQFAHDYPERISSLTLIGSATADGKAMLPHGLHQLKMIEEGGLLAWSKDHTPRAIDRNKVDPGMFDWLLHEMAKEPVEWDVAVKRDLYPSYDVRPLLPKIAVPTLIMIAENTAFGLEHYKEMARLIPNCDLMVFYDALHYIFMSHRDQVLDATLNFLKRLPRSA